MPAANLLLLKRLLSLLQHIGHNTATSRMSCNNLAICVGPNLLSPPNEDLLPLEALLEVTEKVRCLDGPAAAFPARQSLAAQRSLDASGLEQMLVGWGGVGWGGVSAWKSSPRATGFCAEARVGSGSGCLVRCQAAGLRARV